MRTDNMKRGEYEEIVRWASGSLYGGMFSKDLPLDGGADHFKLAAKRFVICLFISYCEANLTR